MLRITSVFVAAFAVAAVGDPISADSMLAVAATLLAVATIWTRLTAWWRYDVDATGQMGRAMIYAALGMITVAGMAVWSLVLALTGGSPLAWYAVAVFAATVFALAEIRGSLRRRRSLLGVA